MHHPAETGQAGPDLADVPSHIAVTLLHNLALLVLALLTAPVLAPACAPQGSATGLRSLVCSQTQALSDLKLQGHHKLQETMSCLFKVVSR